MTPAEQEEWKKKLVLRYHELEKALQSFPQKDVAAVRDVFLKHGDEWDARIREKNGEATKKDIAMLDKRSKEVNQFREILDVWRHWALLKVVFTAHKKGADLLEAATVIGELIDNQDDKSIDMGEVFSKLLKNKKNIN